MAQSSQIVFEDFRLDKARQCLLRNGKVVPLSLKALGILGYLASHAGRLVSKEELLEAVWPGTYVTDAVLKVRIQEVRRALGDDAAQPKYIETAHRRGYRFVAAVGSTTLPVPISSFIGREHEIAEIKRLLANTRLLTVRGAGGSGKTRLALQVAHESLPAYADGAWWVPLAAVSSGDVVAQVVSMALGVREQPGRNLIETLSDYLRNKQLLLVIDNCEHLAAACAALVRDLLSVAEGLKIMATSREPLGVAGETAWLAPPLSLPEAGLTDVGQLSECEAVRLFRDRARELSPNFELTPGNAGIVAGICRRLDGLPLAIELAAARVEVINLQEISARLDNCFALLTAAGHAHVPRHETLRAAIDWSHELLHEKEKILLRRLAIFAGSFTLGAAESVCSGPSLPTSEILDGLTQLVRKSLVMPLAAAGASAQASRYRMLETIRQYSREKLFEAGERELVSLRHAEFFVSLAESMEPNINSAQRAMVMQLLEIEHDNFRAALDWAGATHRQGEIAARMAGALWWFWFHRGFWSEARQRLEIVLSLSAGGINRGKALLAAGTLAWFQGDHGTACLHLRESIEIARRHDETRLLAKALDFLGQTMADAGDLSQASPLAEESVALLEGSNSWDQAIALIDLGNIRRFQGNHSAAIALYEKSAALLRKLHDNWALGMVLRNLGISAFQSHDPARAKNYLCESLSVLRRMEETWFVSRTLEELANVLSAEGEARTAATLFGASEALREITGAAVLKAHRSKYDTSVSALNVALGTKDFQTAWGQGRQMKSEEAIDFALVSTQRSAVSTQSQNVQNKTKRDR